MAVTTRGAVPARLALDALEARLAGIWKAERYRRFREAFESDVRPDPCRDCGLPWSL